MWTLLDTADEPENNAKQTLASQLPDFDRESILSPPPPVTSRLQTVCKSLAMGMLTLALLVALLAQIFYRHFDVIATNTQLRPWLQTICASAGCTLPSRQDARLWQSEGLSVGPHPDFADAVSIEVDIRNTASFSQPLPLLAIVFTDIRGNVMAARQFASTDYLTTPGSITSLPPGELLTAQLAIADPGAEAVNYQVQFVYE